MKAHCTAPVAAAVFGALNAASATCVGKVSICQILLQLMCGPVVQGIHQRLPFWAPWICAALVYHPRLYFGSPVAQLLSHNGSHGFNKSPLLACLLAAHAPGSSCARDSSTQELLMISITLGSSGSAGIVPGRRVHAPACSFHLPLTCAGKQRASCHSPPHDAIRPTAWGQCKACKAWLGMMQATIRGFVSSLMLMQHAQHESGSHVAIC